MTRVDSLLPTLFLIDFGLAQLFHNPATYLHILSQVDVYMTYFLFFYLLTF